MTSLPRSSQASPPRSGRRGDEPPTTGPADNLVIAGLVPMSTVDWPDHLTATVFLQGCPWNCFYCHNRDLIPTRTPGRVAWEEVRACCAAGAGCSTRRPHRRRGAAPGRPGRRRPRGHRHGFQVGLHTAGPYPRRLRDMVGAGLVDWVGLDIKALSEHYGQVVGREGAAARAWESLEVLVEAAGRGGPDFEVRTTVVPGDGDGRRRRRGRSAGARGGGSGLRPPAGPLRGDERRVRRRGARLGRDVRAHGRAHRGPGLGPFHLPPGVGRPPWGAVSMVGGGARS